jgi:hypothetical protein
MQENCGIAELYFNDRKIQNVKLQPSAISIK